MVAAGSTHGCGDDSSTRPWPYVVVRMAGVWICWPVVYGVCRLWISDVKLANVV